MTKYKHEHPSRSDAQDSRCFPLGVLHGGLGQVQSTCVRHVPHHPRGDPRDFPSVPTIVILSRYYCLPIGPQCSKKFRKVLRSLILPRYGREGITVYP
jgi:hypothetical protein